MNKKQTIGINIILLGFVSLITDASSEIITPLMPFFIERVLGITIGVSLIIGFIGNLGESLSSIFKAIAGYWSDKIRRKKPFVAAGYSLSATSKLFFPLASTWEEVSIIKVFERGGKGIRDAPRDAIIAESSEKKKGRGFGIHRAFDSLGAIIGSMLAFLFILVLYPKSGEAGISELIRFIFLFAAILAFFALIPLLWVKDEKKQTTSGYKLGLRNLPRHYYYIIIITGLFALGNFTILLFLYHVCLRYSGILHYMVPILFYVLFNIIYTSFSIPGGNLADKYGKGKILTVGYGLFSLACTTFIFSESELLFILGFGLLGLSFALIDTVQRAYISDGVPPEIRGTALGTFHMIIGLATLPAGIIAGFLHGIDPTYAFIYGAIIALASMLLLMVYSKIHKTSGT
ncbi:MAG: MFS transporter [Candidatus Helarchaeota archaeon]|nr:MFS transporter [Candidatus Helarchaeota archaeon]